MKTRQRQQGIATILIVILLGLAVGVTVLSAALSLKSNQERAIAAHASVPARASAWQALEITRRSVRRLDRDILTAWAAEDALAASGDDVNGSRGAGGSNGGGGKSLTAQSAGRVVQIGDGDAGMQATITRVVAPADDAVGEDAYFEVTVETIGIAAAGTASQATATLQAVLKVFPEYEGTPGEPANPTVPEAFGAMNIYRDLNMRGGIVFRGNGTAVINVDGNVSLDNASIVGIDLLRVTGDVQIGSAIEVNRVHSNGSVTLSGGADVGEIRNRGNVTLSGGTHAGLVHSNGVVTISTGSAGVINNRQDVIITGGGVNIDEIITEGSIQWTGTGGGLIEGWANGQIIYNANRRNPTTRLHAIGDVATRGNGSTLIESNGNVLFASSGVGSEIRARGNLNHNSTANVTNARVRGDTNLSSSGGIVRLEGGGNLYVGGWQSVAGTIGGTLTKVQQWNTSVNVNVQPGFRPVFDAVAPVAVPEMPEFSIPPPGVNAYPLRASANYIFEYRNERIEVTARQVSNIPDGTYVLGNKYQQYNTYPDWLCHPDNMTGAICTVPVATLCQGFSAQSSCFSYEKSTATYSINGSSMARGIVWLDGHLTLGSGTYINTFVAMGDIRTSGAHRTLSPNYAGYAAVCTNAVPNGTNGAPAHNLNFNGMYPTNLCNLDEQTMIRNPLGNVGLVAGGYFPGSDTLYGGNVNLSASTRIDGAVFAANIITTGGSTVVNGAITAAGQGQEGVPGRPDSAEFGGSTTIDLTGGADEYDPGDLPCMVDCVGTPATEGNPLGRASVVWTRYL